MEVEEAIKMLRNCCTNMNNNLVFFKTKLRLYLLYLVLRDKIENLFHQISNFEKGTRNKKGYLVVEREFLLLNLTRFFEIEKSRHALVPSRHLLS